MAVQDGAGPLRHRLTFAERNEIEDDYGNSSSGWVERFTVHASITPRLGGEAAEAARLAGRQPVIIRVRQSPDTRMITTAWKVTAQDGTEYNIRSAVDPNMGDSQHGFWIDMLAETGVAA